MGPQNSIKTEKVTLVSKRKDMGIPDTVTTTQGSLSEMVLMGQGTLDPISCPWPDPRDRLEGLLVLMPSRFEGHDGSQ